MYGWHPCHLSDLADRLWLGQNQPFKRGTKVTG